VFFSSNSLIVIILVPSIAFISSKSLSPVTRKSDLLSTARFSKKSSLLSRHNCILDVTWINIP
ncbi:MAG: hypothetical protein WC265_06025, partial [Dysgonamonadaceae bacterium]